MICRIYRSNKKTDTYLYLRQAENEPQNESQGDQADFSAVPDTLLNMLGRLEWVMDIDLSTRSQLAQVDCATLIKQLDKAGYFLQLPPAYYRGV